MRVALLHPGEMGAAIGRLLLADGHDVAWASHGRSPASAGRAVGFTDKRVVPDLLADRELVLSVCPPEAAVAVAEEVARTGFDGVYVDANAIAPDTARRLGACLASRFVDGGIVGGPPVRPGTTRLYLSGDGARDVAALFAGSALEAITLDAPAGAASALKVCYAAYTKGTTALLLAIRALASTEGVDDALLGEWARSQPNLGDRSDAGARRSAAKAWRFAGEMEEIADALDAASVPDGFHRGAAEVYRRLTRFKDAAEPPTLAEMIEVVREQPG